MKLPQLTLTVSSTTEKHTNNSKRTLFFQAKLAAFSNFLSRRQKPAHFLFTRQSPTQNRTKFTCRIMKAQPLLSKLWWQLVDFVCFGRNRAPDYTITRQSIKSSVVVLIQLSVKKKKGVGITGGLVYAGMCDWWELIGSEIELLFTVPFTGTWL